MKLKLFFFPKSLTETVASSRVTNPKAPELAPIARIDIKLLKFLILFLNEIESLFKEFSDYLVSY